MPGESLLSDDSTSADEVSVKSDSKSVLAEVMRDLRRAREKKEREASGKEGEGKERRVKKTLKEREEERARRQERAAGRCKEGGGSAGPVEKGQGAGPVEVGRRSSSERGEKGEAGETSKREKPDSQIIRAGNGRSSIRAQKKGKEDEGCSSTNSEENLEVRADKKSGQRRKQEQNSRKEGQGAGNISRRVLNSEKEVRRREH